MLASCIINPAAAQLKLDYAREGILYYEPCAKPAKQKPDEKDKSEGQAEEGANDSDTTTISRSTDNQVENAGDQSEDESTASQTEEAKERASSGQATVLCCDDHESSGASIALVGGDNIEKLFNYLVDRGLSAEQSAGALGNLIQESGGGGDINPNAVNPSSGAKGMIQWYEGRATRLDEIAAKKGGKWNDVDIQAYYMGWELGFEDDNVYAGQGPTHTHVGNAMKAASSIEEATKIWLETYEIPCLPGSAECAHELTKRLSFARGVYEKYGDGAGTGSVGRNEDACAEGNATAAEGFVYYNQGDQQWNNDGLPIALAGCGPSSLAMIIATLKDKSVTPVVTAKYLQSIGSWDSNGLQWHGIPTIAKKYNLEYTDLGTDWEAAKKSLREGKLIMISGQGPSPFTSGGHLIVGRGITEDGKIIIANPGDRTQESTPFATPIPGLMHIWAFQ